MGVPVVSGVAKKVFGTRNERLVKRYLRIVDEVSSHEPSMHASSPIRSFAPRRRNSRIGCLKVPMSIR